MHCHRENMWREKLIPMTVLSIFYFAGFLITEQPFFYTPSKQNVNLVCYFMEMELFQGKHLSPNIETIYLSPSCSVANTSVLQ